MIFFSQFTAQNLDFSELSDKNVELWDKTSQVPFFAKKLTEKSVLRDI